MNLHVTLYRAAARALAFSVLRTREISAVCVRRSVASGDARLPFSDIDFDLTVSAARGATMARVARRFRLARSLFPRTGHCFVLTELDIRLVAELEPYRASINRRCGLVVRGELPEWPVPALSPLEVARRVVFWLDEYFPEAMRAGHRRNQRKFRLEMYNALGILERRWSEPRISLREVAEAYGAEDGRTPFASGLEAARRAATALGIDAPRLRHPVELPGLTILPTSDWPWPRAARGAVATPEALVLLLRTQRPTLWIEHHAALVRLGFDAPSLDSWVGMAKRLASPQWARGPGFFEQLSGLPLWRLEVAEHLVDAAERGCLPSALPMLPGAPGRSVRDYYRRVYDGIAERAAALRARLASMGPLDFSNSSSPAVGG